MLESRDEVRVDRWLPLGIAGSGLGARFLGLADPKDAVQQPERVLRACVLGDQQEDASVGCFKGCEKSHAAYRSSRQTLQMVGPANRTPAAAQPRRRMSATARSSVALGLPRIAAICAAASRIGMVVTCQVPSCGASFASSRRARSRSSSEGAYSSARPPVRNCRNASASWPSAWSAESCADHQM